jgi:tetratricopeptide (TPR) repeat protein
VLHYLHGEILLQKGQFKAAFNQFEKFQKTTRGVNFIQDSYFKQFLCGWLPGDTREAERSLNQVNLKGTQVVEADKYAVKFAVKYRGGEIANENKVLFRARYASDGGYFEAASGLLKNYSENSFRQASAKAEYNYRTARIIQQMKHPQQAVPYFKKAISLSEKTDFYFGAAAALQLGYIFKDNNKDTAVFYFRKAISFKRHEYKNSIDNKARAALTEMKAPNT